MITIHHVIPYPGFLRDAGSHQPLMNCLEKRYEGGGVRPAGKPFTNIFATICTNIFVMVVLFGTVEDPEYKSHNLTLGVFRTKQEGEPLPD